MRCFAQRKRFEDLGRDKKDASLVITGEGDLSGDIVNTAARLQAGANKLSTSLLAPK
jgi:hypothetical protein